jgi:HKD family nuclease
MFIVQNVVRPAEIQNALYDLLRGGVESVRVCSAYVSMSGSEMLLDAISRASQDGRHDGVRKTVVTSLDFGLTDPAALALWMNVPNCAILVAGTSGVQVGRLIPRTAFHPKFYIVGRPDGHVGSLVGSANLTNRGLTINSEVAWLQLEHEQPEPVNEAWEAAVQPAVPLTADILDQYSALRQRLPAERPVEELEPVPAPEVGPLQRYTVFADANMDPGAFDQMWIQSRGLQGGANTQLELPRGAHRFFGATYEGYDFERVEHIAEPILVAGHRTWRDRPLTWHGDNAMERINLPSQTMGGFAYENSLILFRRIAQNTFELRVHPWESDSARACVEASRQAGLVLRVGRSSNRLVGFIR